MTADDSGFVENLRKAEAERDGIKPIVAQKRADLKEAEDALSKANARVGERRADLDAYRKEHGIASE